MAWNVFKRAFEAIPLLLGIATITFFIVHIAPGDLMDRRSDTYKETLWL